MGTNDIKLLIKSYETWTHIKHSITKNYHSKKWLDINKSLK